MSSNNILVIMIPNRETAGYFRPSYRELAFGVCCVLEQVGGRLTFERTAEVVGDFLKIPEDVRSLPCPRSPRETDWNHCMAVACRILRNKGFMAKNDVFNWGDCILTDAGRELGQWAKQLYNGEVIEMPNWVEVFLRPTFNQMKRLLRGGHKRKIPDYELCRWVWYCYLLDRPKIGTEIFNLILADHVDPQLYREAERQARVLKLHLQEQEEYIEQDQIDVVVGRSSNQLGRQRRKRYEKIYELCRNEELRRWMIKNIQVHKYIRSLVRDVYNIVLDISETGIRIRSSKSGQERLIEWGPIEYGYNILQSKGILAKTDVPGRGSFVCSLLSCMPDVIPVSGQCAIRLDTTPHEGEDIFNPISHATINTSEAVTGNTTVDALGIDSLLKDELNEILPKQCDFKAWVMSTFSDDMHIRNIGGSKGVHLIVDLSTAGLTVKPAGNDITELLPWRILEASYRKLRTQRCLRHFEVPYTKSYTISNIACSLLSYLPGALTYKGRCVVELR